MTYALVQRDNIGSKQIFDTFEDLLVALPEDTSNYDIEVLSAADEEDEEPVFGDALGFADEPDVFDDMAKLGAEALSTAIANQAV